MTEQRYPEPTVGALIFNPEGQLFLMRSHKWHGQYVIPGGHIELGETMIDALKREVKEETNLDIFAVEFVCFQEFIHDDRFWERRHFIFFDYACRARPGKVVLNDEAQEYVWVDIDRVSDHPVEHYTEIALKTYLERKGG